MNAIAFALLLAAIGGGPEVSGILRVDGRWEYPHYLGFRPADGTEVDVNPPRMSWPYLPQVIPQQRVIPATEFTLQFSRSGDFSRPDFERVTQYNFENALPVMEPGEWRWRVGYAVGTAEEQWSVARRFTVGPDAVRWDRTVIDRAAERLAALARPRLAPGDGDFAAWRQRLEADPDGAVWLRSLIQQAERATRQRWWRDFPTTDVAGQSAYDEQQFANMARDLAAAAFAWRLTGDERFAAARDHAVALARFPQGGLASPEYHGAPRKWPTQITEMLAVCYDLFHEQLSDEQSETIRGSIAWRLEAVYLQRHSWRLDDGLARSGVAVFCSSHPYENFMWSLPAVLLLAGDLELADALVPLCLNYLTGVSSAHGPDEGWNEGLAYGSWKGATMLQAALTTHLLLPELELGRSPYFVRLGQWYRHLLPLGIERLSFGDYAAEPQRALATQSSIFRHLAWLTGEPTFTHRWRAIAEQLGVRPSGRVWLDLLASDRLILPPPEDAEPARAVFPEAGWVMASTHAPSDRAAFDRAVGMIFQCRPMGGFSHSFRNENDFVWHAYGRTLAAGGGGTAYPDPHSRHSISHHVILVDGHGQQGDPRQPARPFVGRLLAHHPFEPPAGPGGADDALVWVGDATNAYPQEVGLARWHRYVVFLGGEVFVVFDDLAMRPEADPARFSWLFHIAPQVPLQIDSASPGFHYTLGEVAARVALAGPADALEIADQPGRQGFVNRITGEDLYDHTVERLKGAGRTLARDQWMAHNLWVTNRQPAQQWQFLAVLSAAPVGETLPTVSFTGQSVATVRLLDGRQWTVSFDPTVPGDVTLDPAELRGWAESSDPASLPTSGTRERLVLAGDDYQVEWLFRENFDRGLAHWVLEGNAEVQVEDQRLVIRNRDPETRTAATLWLRPELPERAVVRFRASVLPPDEGNAANLNLILHARELDGQPVRFGRSGQYRLYHELPNYIVTFTGGFAPGWSRARRNPGFELLHESDLRAEVGRDYEIAVTIDAGRLRYYVDGVRIHDVVDPQPLPAGRFAIRTWSTNAAWSDLQVGRLHHGPQPD
jgi:hypothetical protein